MPRIAPLRRRHGWWVVGGLCALPTLVRWTWPTLVPSDTLANAQQFAFGSLMILAAEGGVRRWRVLRRHDAGAQAYATRQRRVAGVLGLLVSVILVFAALTGRFSEMGGWMLLPLAVLGPALFATGDRANRAQ